MKKVIKFVKGKRDEKKESGGITPSASGELLSPAQTPEDERFLGLDSTSGYIVDFCGKDKTLTKLHKAAWQGNLDKLKTSLKKIEIDAVDRHNRSALHYAVVQGHPNIVWFLLGNNAKMAICDDEGRTPLLKSIECAHKECMTLLLERGADVNNTDYNGSTGLHIAAKLGSLDIASALLNRNADFEIANNSGEYPLHIATRSQNKDLVELLLRCGASVNIFDRENRTPLMLAAKTGNLLLAQLFFEYGAQLTVVDSNGWTAEDYALLGGHQNVATELKALLKKENSKSDSSKLATHKEEDELDMLKSPESSNTWNDSQLSEEEPKDSITKKLNQFFKNCSNDGIYSEDKEEEPQELQESPGPGIVPPPCRPPRSWEIIQAGMIDENTEGVEPKRRSIMTLGTLHSRRESFTESSSNTHGEVPRCTLSLNRRRDAKKRETYAKQRLSFNEEKSLQSWMKEDSPSGSETGAKAKIAKRSKTYVASDSDWESDFSISLEPSKTEKKKKEKIRTSLERKDKVLTRTLPIDIGLTDSDSTDSLVARMKRSMSKQSDDGTLGRSDTLQGVEEVWVSNARVSHPTEQPADIIPERENAEIVFPPPPSELELGADMAKSMSYIKGVSIDHPPGSKRERDVWKNAYESHSLDRLDEKDKGSLTQLESFTEKPDAAGRRQGRHKVVSTQKWRSEELPQCQKPVDRLVDVNRRINEQLECYDQALRELAESPYAKKQDAIISTLTSSKSSKAQNYYSLPASKFRSGLATAKQRAPHIRSSESEHSVSSLHGGAQFISHNTYYYDKPPFGSKPFLEMGSGPVSLPFFVNDENGRSYQLCPKHEVENNEALGSEDTQRPGEEAKKSQLEMKILEGENAPGGANGGQGDKKDRRHILLAMRDVKHAVQVTASFKGSLDEQILSPLTKTSSNFDLDEKKFSPKATSSSSETASPEAPYFCGSCLARQVTVIEKSDLRRRSSSSGTGEEPTLWLQDEHKQEAHKQDKPTSFSPLGAVYREIQAERANDTKHESSSTSTSTSSTTDDNVMDAALAGMQRKLKRIHVVLDGHREVSKELEEELNDVDSDQSPDVSSCAMELITTEKDSGSEVDSAQDDGTPAHHKERRSEAHREWVQRQLQAATTNRTKLDTLAATMTQKAESLQYELADAKEATRSRDEVIILLQEQLSKMEEAYTKSLEESVKNRLQLSTHEQEILHLKELCFKYEDEKEKQPETGGAGLESKLKTLQEDKERLKKEVLRLEQDKLTLEKRLQEMPPSEMMEDYKIWKERCNDPTPEKYSKNQKIETEVQSLTIELEEERNTSKIKQESIVDLNKRNKELEERLRRQEKKENDEEVASLKKENMDLKRQLKESLDLFSSSQIRKVLDDNNETLRGEISVLKEQCMIVTKSISEIQNRDKHELDTLMKENLNLKKEISELKIKLMQDDNDVPNFKVELLELVSENTSIKSQILDLQNQVEILNDTLNKERQLLSDCKAKNDVLELNMKGESKQNTVRVSKKREVGKQDELAWTNLYGIKQVGTKREEMYKDEEIDVKKVSELMELKQQLLDMQHRVVDEKSLRFALENRISEITLDLKDTHKLELEMDMLKRRTTSTPIVNVDSGLNKEVEMEMVDERYKQRVELLARERDRAKALRLKLCRKANSLDAPPPPVKCAPVKFHSFPRTSSQVLTVTMPELDLDMIARLDHQLDQSIRKYSNGDV